MWRFLPKSWFSSSDASDRAQQQVVDALHGQWRRWLADALSRVLKDSVLQEMGPGLLATIETKHLIALDQTLRYGDWDISFGQPTKVRVPLRAISGSREDIDAYLFTLGCNANGFIREQALVAFRASPGRLATALSLIRCDDWVPQIQTQALVLLQNLVKHRGGFELLEFADLLIALRERKRATERIWTEVIEPALLDPACAAARWKATQQGSAQSRLFAYTLVARVELERIKPCCLQAIRDASPAIAHWALGLVRSSHSRAEALDVVRLALRHPHVSIRAEGLRQIAAIDPQGSREIVEQALFDSAASPRNAAAYLIRNVFQRDPLEYWREALDKDAGPRARAAILALADFAGPDDADRIVRWLTHSKAEIRAAALRALVRAAPTGVSDQLIRALKDSSARVVRQAVALFKGEPAALNAEVLREAYCSAASDAARAQPLMRATTLLNKWEGLELLLEWLHEADDALAIVLANGLRLWLAQDGNRFAPLNSAARQRLAIAVATARTKLGAIPWERIEYAVKYG